MRQRIVAMIVMVGLLLQATAVVRHASMLISASLSAAIVGDIQQAANPQERELAADLLASICHPEGGSGLSAPASPGGPVKGDMSGCPICNGLVSVFALAPCVGLVGPAVLADGVITFAPFDQRVVRHAFLRPQSRGPPAQG